MADLRGSHSRFWEEIAARGVGETAARSGAGLEGNFIVVSLDRRRFLIDPREGRILEDGPSGLSDAPFLESVVLVTYLARADGSPLSGEWVSEKGLELGEVYFRPPHEMPSRRLAQNFGADPDGFVRAAKALGGFETFSADRSVQIPSLPKVPVRLNLWLPSDEFPEADVRFLFDRNATRYLILDGILSLANIVARDMLRAA